MPCLQRLPLPRQRDTLGVEYLNPDDIARDRFGDWNLPEAVLEAARWSDPRRQELLVAGLGIALETVFSTPATVDFLARAKARGHFSRLFFHWYQRPAHQRS